MVGNEAGNGLAINGGSNDTVAFDSNFTVTGTQVIDSITYDVYTNPNLDSSVSFLLQQGLTAIPLLPVIEASAIASDSNDQGFVINGASSGDTSGQSVSTAGDVNGDGFADLIIGASKDNANNNSDSGASFVVFGKTDGTAVELTANNGFVINGINTEDYSGYSVSGAGDVNGDGLADVIVGAIWDDPNGSKSGAGFVVFGKTDGAAVELSALEQNTDISGFAINGAGQNDNAGRSVSAAGDVNGDGLADVIVGANLDDPNDNSRSGASFVVFGKTDGVAIELSALEQGSDLSGFAINGANANDSSGQSVSDAGDVNGDGLADLIVGAGANSTNGATSGASYVVFGKTDGTAIELSALEQNSTAAGFVINGASAEDLSGLRVSNAGDVNGDGLADLIVGASKDDPNESNAGASFVVFGKTDTSVIELSAIEQNSNAAGFVINGVSENDNSGRSVSSAGDINGDGLADLIVGALNDDPNGDKSGASFVVFGKTDGTAIELSAVEQGLGGFVINGVEERGNSGTSVSAAGDVNGDGFDDVIVGANHEDPNDIGGSGASYVIFGGQGTSATVGTENAETLTGNSDANQIVAGRGDDILVGNGGADVLRGGGGNDILAISDANFASLNGGLGTDTLRLDAAINLDLTAIGNTRLSGIEVIDLNNTGSTLTLSSGDILNLMGDEAANALNINGGSNDSIAFDINSEFVSNSTDVVDGVTYDVYTSRLLDDSVRVFIGQDIAVSGTVLPAVTAANIQAGIGGFAVNGASNYDFSGASVSGGGDVNGDGFADVLIGAHSDDPNGPNSGATFVVFGSLAGSSVALSELELNSNNSGFVINGVSTGDSSNSNQNVASAGDVNGDGFADVIVGALLDQPAGQGSGASFVVFGKTDGSVVELSDVETGSNHSGFVINGASQLDYSGRSVSAAGDVNGDGFNDLIVGAAGDDPNGDNSGASFVVFGKTDGSVVELSALENSGDLAGFVINGTSGASRSGLSVSGAGDVNGDGLADIIVGRPYSSAEGRDESGMSYVVFGKTDGAAVELSAVEAGAGGFVLNGVSTEDGAGNSVSAAGDVNGDGFEDIIVGAAGVDSNGSSSGASYLVFGKTDGTAVQLSSVASNAEGFVINGVASGDSSGVSVSGAGDINGDGLADLIVGGFDANSGDTQTGASYLVFGKTDSAGVELSAVENGVGGFHIHGVAAYSLSGYSVSGAGDVNGDGFDDVIVGAPGTNSISGTTFIVYGGQGSDASIGTAGADTLNGDSTANQIVAGQGNDTLIGNGGADVLRGGEGDDILAISDANFANLDGGLGTDTLRFDAAIALDLTALSDSAIQSIEGFDLSADGGNSSLTLNLTDVLNLSENSNILNIDGSTGDSLTLNNTSNGQTGTWALTNDGAGTDTYSFSSGGDVLASILVDDSLSVSII